MRLPVRISLRVPVIWMVLAATAIPVEWRRPGCATLSFEFHRLDFAANVAGFVPVGMVLAGWGPWGVPAAAAMSVLAEAGQFVMANRDPSVMDVVANVLGAMLVAALGARRWIPVGAMPIGRWKGLGAATAALLLAAGVWARAGDVPSARGVTAPGGLEAWWKFDESGGRVALDSAGHGLEGRFRGQPGRVAGVRGGAVRLDGVKDYIDCGRSSAFRITGSMTLSAWIKPSSFPVDDAAIVSQFHNGSGYQLDTTVDRGPRTIGFKLTNARGELMIRYGATALAAGVWHHVAGVYDARARRLDVYLDGKPDNGDLRGTVTGTQRSSRGKVTVGRRSDQPGYDFAGVLDDVRMYSFALTREEIAAEMRGDAVAGPAEPPGREAAGEAAPCTVMSDPDDAAIPGAAGTLGVLAALACAGLWPAAGRRMYLAAGLAAGVVLIPAMGATLPWFTRGMMALVSLAGGASVAVAAGRGEGRRVSV